MITSAARKPLLILGILAAPGAQAQDLVSRVIGPDGLTFVVFIAFLLIVIGLPLQFASRRERRRHALYSMFIDKGQEIPRELLPPLPTRESSRQRELNRGVWLVSLGLGLGVALYIFTDEWRIAAWALIFLFLGVASFINALLLRSRPGSDVRVNSDD